MGVVYRAEDTKLGRVIALKFLNASALDDEEAKGRFLREARAAAALDHSNVCAIHDIDEVDGRTFLAMSFIEGEDIREKVARRPLPLGAALDYAIQVAQGLQAAHAKGIVHRDIKSANLMVTPRGQVKIMDFGLARLADQSRLTKTATFLGTPAYMSPEQAERKETDARTDIWSLGVVLYEMVSGRLPFEGENEHGVLYGIVSSEPEPLTALRTGLPVELDRIVAKAMAKKPEERYQHVDELLVDLRALRKGSEADSPRAIPKGEARPQRSLASRFWPAAVIIIAFGIWVLRPPPEPMSSPSSGARPTPLTSYPGREIFPTFSPDGDRVAFAWEGENRDNWDLYVTLIGENTPQRLTSHAAEDTSPAWSPDGRWIAFVRLENDISTVILIPSIGGTERPILHGQHYSNTGIWNSVARRVAWHPDSEHLVVSHVDEGKISAHLYLVSIETGEARPLTQSDSRIVGDFDPAVSPDGRRVAFRRKYGHWSGELHIVDLAETLDPVGSSRRLTDVPYAFSPTWSLDGKTILFAAETAENPRLWQVSPEGGQAHPVRRPTEGAFLALSPSGNRAAFSYVSVDYDIWQARRPDFLDPEPLISSTYIDIGPMFSPDGKRIAFSSSRSGYREIWVCDRDGSNPVQITDLKSVLSANPYWSPDGTRLVFNTIVDNQSEVVVVRSTGGKIERITNHPAHDIQPSWSRDGEWIYFSSDRLGEQTIWKTPAAGGDAVQVTEQRGTFAIESLDGRTLYFTKPEGLWSVPVLGGDPEIIVEGDMSGDSLGVARDGIYMARQRRTQLDFFDFQSKAVSTLFEPQQPTYAGLSVSPDGQTILWVQGRLPESGIMLVDEFR